MNDKQKTKNELLQELMELRKDFNSFKMNHDEYKVAHSQELERVSEANFLNLAESSQDGILIASASGKHLYANLPASEMLGYLPDELLKTTQEGLTFPDANPIFHQRLQDKADGSPLPLIYDTFIRRKNGTAFSAEVTFTPTLWQGQNCDLVLIRDLTKTREAQEVLYQSKKELSSLMDYLPGMVYSCLNDRGWTMKFVSNGAFELTGYLPGEFTGSDPLPYNDIIHPDDREMVWNTIQQCLVQNIPYELEYRILTKSGQVRDVWERGQRISINDNPVEQLEGFITDITKRCETEKALRETEEIFRCFMEFSPIYVFFKDPNIRSLRLSRNFETMIGKPLDELLGKNMEELFPSDLSKKMVTDDQHILKNGRAITVEEEFNGQIFTTIKFPIFIDEKIRYLAGFTIDITERKRIEEEMKNKNQELQNLIAARDKFFSIIAHDLRNPFNGFMELTQVMSKDLFKLPIDELQDIVISMSKSAANLYQLLENLLQWSQVQNGSIPFNPKMIPLMNVMNESLDSIREQAKMKGIEIVTDIPKELVVFADHDIIQAVLRNLISNAVKFNTKKGKVILMARATGENCVEIAIQDTGIGMNQKIMDSLFRIDVQSKRTGTEGELSTGLGLLLCKEFIERHNGKIWVKSEEGTGSAFYFTLPYNIQ